MSRAEKKARTLLVEQLGLIDDIVRFIGRRGHLKGEELEEFHSHAVLKLIDRNYAILRQFKQKSSLRTYLTVVVQRLLLDYHNQRWGKWRPSAKARRLGEEAIYLDRLLSRDGHSTVEAIEILKVNKRVTLSRKRLHEIASELPQRPRRIFEGEERLETEASPDKASRLLDERDRLRLASQGGSVLRKALGRLDPEERIILKLRFLNGFTVPEIARALGLDGKPLYRRIDRTLSRLREQLEKEGLSKRDFASLDWRFAEIGFDFERPLATSEGVHRDEGFPGAIEAGIESRR